MGHETDEQGENNEIAPQRKVPLVVVASQPSSPNHQGLQRKTPLVATGSARRRAPPGGGACRAPGGGGCGRAGTSLAGAGGACGKCGADSSLAGCGGGCLEPAGTESAFANGPGACCRASGMPSRFKSGPVTCTLAMGGARGLAYVAASGWRAIARLNSSRSITPSWLRSIASNAFMALSVEGTWV